MHTEFRQLKIGVLTISDTRNMDTDKSGSLLCDLIKGAEHQVSRREIVKDDIYRIRAIVSSWLVDDEVEVILTTGGTGITARDGTPEAIKPLLDKVLEGFGETFRHYSLEDVGPSTIQSRALAGVANGSLVFCLPGSTGACKTGWEKLIRVQLDSRTRPCNLADLLEKLKPDFH